MHVSIVNVFFEYLRLINRKLTVFGTFPDNLKISAASSLANLMMSSRDTTSRYFRVIEQLPGCLPPDCGPAV